MRRFLIVFVWTLASGIWTGPLLAQTPPRQLDGLTAGRQAYEAAEARRQAAIAGQIQTNRDAQYYSDLARWRDNTYYYGTPYGGPIIEDYHYRRSPYGGLYRRYSITSSPYLYPGAPVNPYILSPRYSDPIRQPIGQRQVQTGPNRWESYPIYETDATAQPQLTPVPPTPEPRTPVIPAPQIKIQEFPPKQDLPAGDQPSGPREF